MDCSFSRTHVVEQEIYCISCSEKEKLDLTRTACFPDLSKVCIAAIFKDI